MNLFPLLVDFELRKFLFPEQEWLSQESRATMVKVAKVATLVFVSTLYVLHISEMVCQQLLKKHEGSKKDSTDEVSKKACEILQPTPQSEKTEEEKQTPREIKPTPTPVGLYNEKSTCFLAAAIQLIRLNPDLEEAFIEEFHEGGNCKEVGQLLENMRLADKEKISAIHGIGQLRALLATLSGNADYLQGQWDANEVIRVLTSNHESSLCKKLLSRGYLIRQTERRYFELPENCTPDPKEDLSFDQELGLWYLKSSSNKSPEIPINLHGAKINAPLKTFLEQSGFSHVDGQSRSFILKQNSKLSSEKISCNQLFEKTTWDNPELIQHITVNLNRFTYDKKPIKINTPILIEEIEQFPIGDQKIPMELVGFTVHRGNSIDHGHWISYTASNGRYTCNNDNRITEIPKDQFLREAKTASDLLYKRVR